MKISNFMKTEYKDSAVYNNYRMLANYIDGLKPSKRKVVHTIKKSKIFSNTIKVSQLGAKVAEATHYLHGDVSLADVITDMAKNYVNTNNINLLEPDGHFGNRFDKSASAPRYIQVCGTKQMQLLFNENDDKILITQEFEGDEIEPKYFVPILPLILLNGTNGETVMGNGFAQCIVPRHIDDIIKYIKCKLNNEPFNDILRPYFKGYEGTVVFDKENSRFENTGKFFKDKRKKKNIIVIKELPVHYQRDEYIAILNKLEENDVIETYKDFSGDDRYNFELIVSENFANQTDDEIMKALYLKDYMTDNFNCMDENNSVREFKNEYDILDSYIEKRLEYYQKRKDFLIDKLTKEINIISNRIKFVTAVVKKNIVVVARNENEIIEDLKKLEIKEFGGNYNYLLDMSIRSFTSDLIKQMVEKYKQKKEEYIEIENTLIKDMWLNDIKEYLNNSKKS